MHEAAMKACVLPSISPVETNPLKFVETALPEPAPDEVLVHVEVCGVCRTDLHVVEGELAPRKAAIIPGHQVVSTVAKLGSAAKRFQIGARVGIAWLHRTCRVGGIAGAGRGTWAKERTSTATTVMGGK